MRRLYAMGVITTKKSLVQLEKLSTSAFCRRRLSVVMVRLKMAETLKEACTLIEQVNRHCLSNWCTKPLQALTHHVTALSGHMALPSKTVCSGVHKRQLE